MYDSYSRMGRLALSHAARTQTAQCYECTRATPACWIPIPEVLLQEAWNGARECAFLTIPRDTAAAGGGPHWEGPGPAHDVAQRHS